MTADEFLELKQWMTDRWPTLSSFTQGQWLAYRDELACFEIANVWSALQLCFQSGAEYPPNVAKLSRMTAGEERDRARKALPAAGGICWAEYSRNRWGEVIGWLDAAKRLVEGTLE